MFANIFSLNQLSFTLLVVALDCQNILILMKSNFSIEFYYLCFWHERQKIIAKSMSEDFLSLNRW